MKTNIIIPAAALAAFTLLLVCCGKTKEKDMIPPEIIAVGDYTSPLNCQEFHVGGVLPFAWAFSDNEELGSFNIEIHSNHDHHTHSTEAEECPEHEEVHDHGDPVNPWVFNKDYAIPAGTSYYEADIKIPIPEGIDPGEYHFMIRVTDISGWQEIKSVAIHIEEGE